MSHTSSLLSSLLKYSFNLVTGAERNQMVEVEINRTCAHLKMSWRGWRHVGLFYPHIFCLYCSSVLLVVLILSQWMKSICISVLIQHIWSLCLITVRRTQKTQFDKETLIEYINIYIECLCVVHQIFVFLPQHELPAAKTRLKALKTYSTCCDSTNQPFDLISRLWASWFLSLIFNTNKYSRVQQRDKQQTSVIQHQNIVIQSRVNPLPKQINRGSLKEKNKPTSRQLIVFVSWGAAAG